MKKITALIILLALLIANIAILSSCFVPDEDPFGPGPSQDQLPPDDDDDNDDEEDDDTSDDDSSNLPASGIIQPSFKDYGRGTVDFTEYVDSYARPDAASLAAGFKEVALLVEKNEVSFEDQLAAVYGLLDDYENFRSMYTVAEIMSYKDLGDAAWRAEYDSLSASAPSVSQAVEALLVAAAQSEHVLLFEADPAFGDELYENYASGPEITDNAVILYEQEAECISRYYDLSPETVEITYGGVTDTYANMLTALAAKYSKDSIQYDYYAGEYENAYQNVLYTKMLEIYIELVSIRGEIAEELGYDSYLDVAYEERGYEYTPNQYLAFAEEIAKNITELHEYLYTLIFYYTYLEMPTKVHSSRVANDLYTLFSSMDTSLGEAYSYMLQHGLYDISTYQSGRYDGSFVTFINGNNSPFLFVTAKGNITDYSSLSHEFGHFVDAFVNGGGASSLELAEVCSQSLEFVALRALGNTLSEVSYNYLRESMLCDALEVMMFQGMYALFEHYVYTADHNLLTVDMLNQLAADAAEAMLGSSDIFNISVIDASFMMVPHLLVSPMYVQSYSTSIVPALEIYIMEGKNAGDGLDAYLNIINRPDGRNSSFLETLESIGLSSPFGENTLYNLVDAICFDLLGKNYHKVNDNQNAA